MSMMYMLEKAFGKRIADFQGVQFQLRASRWKSSPLASSSTQRSRSRVLPFLKEAAMAKLAASEVAERAASLAVEFTEA